MPDTKPNQLQPPEEEQSDTPTEPRLSESDEEVISQRLRELGYIE